MSLMHHYFGLLGSLLVVLAIPLIFIRQPRLPRKFITITLFMALGIAILPIHDLAIIAYIRGVIGDLSIISMIALMLFITHAYTGKTYFSDFEKLRLRKSIILLGLILYPLALGLSPMDSYSLGYGSPWLLPVIAISMICLMIGQSWIILVMFSCGIAGYVFGIMESTNLWDYLIDLWIFLYSLIAVLTDLLLSQFRKST